MAARSLRHAPVANWRFWQRPLKLVSVQTKRLPIAWGVGPTSSVSLPAEAGAAMGEALVMAAKAPMRMVVIVNCMVMLVKAKCLSLE